MKHNVVVIGGGAAGLVAAGFAARNGAAVTILEKTGIAAKKIRITGKGRCNVTNATPNLREFVSNYPTNGRFLFGALHRFSNDDCFRFFENLGVPLKIERGQRVFPQSDDADQVADALVKFAQESGARIIYEQRAVKINVNRGQVTSVQAEGPSGKRSYQADSVILATGGVSYPKTGSSGDGYQLAKQCGHQILRPHPALVPLTVQEKWVRDLSGLSLKNVTLTFSCGTKPFSEFGEMMFAHFGITGPIVLNASQRVEEWLHTNGKQSLAGSLDLKPRLTLEQLDKRLVRDLAKYPRKQLKNAFNDLLPQALIPIVIKLSGLPEDKPANQLSKAERTSFCNILKNIPLTVTGTLPVTAAIVTAGGIDVREIDPRTMESRIVKGLYPVGEVIDVNGVTGGFNLQAAFSTGYLAAYSL